MKNQLKLDLMPLELRKQLRVATKAGPVLALNAPLVLLASGLIRF
jgi:hypothetical protein